MRPKGRDNSLSKGGYTGHVVGGILGKGQAMRKREISEN